MIDQHHLDEEVTSLIDNAVSNGFVSEYFFDPTEPLYWIVGFSEVQKDEIRITIDFLVTTKDPSDIYNLEIRPMGSYFHHRSVEVLPEQSAKYFGIIYTDWVNNVRDIISKLIVSKDLLESKNWPVVRFSA